jgi:hypothetical protein
VDRIGFGASFSSVFSAVSPLFNSSRPAVSSRVGEQARGEV